MFTEVVRLWRISTTVPVSTSSAECSSSALRRQKTFALLWPGSDWMTWLCHTATNKKPIAVFLPMKIKNLYSEMVDFRQLVTTSSALIGHLTAQYYYIICIIVSFFVIWGVFSKSPMSINLDVDLLTYNNNNNNNYYYYYYFIIHFCSIYKHEMIVKCTFLVSM